MEASVRLVDEDGPRYTSAQRNAEHLADSHETDAVGDIRGFDLQLRNGEACLAIRANPNSKKDRVPVNFCIAGRFIGSICITVVSEVISQYSTASAKEFFLQSKPPPMACRAQPKRYHG